MTVDYFRSDYSRIYKLDGSLYKQFEINNRETATQGPRSDGGCTLVVDIKGGGIQLDTASQTADSCQILTQFAKGVVPTLPAGS